MKQIRLLTVQGFLLYLTMILVPCLSVIVKALVESRRKKSYFMRPLYIRCDILFTTDIIFTGPVCNMTNNNIRYLKDGLGTAFIDHTISSNLAYKPQFISNSYKEGCKVISSIEEELLSCDEFCISVAFITMGGITPLLQTLKELEKRNVPGKILTTDYLTFSEPEALKRLEGLSNIELKMYVTEEGSEGFHTKGYVFRKDEMYRIIVGSSNVTQSALTVNREWNTRIVSTDRGEYTQDIINEFRELWNSQKSIDFEQFIARYEDRYTKHRIIRKQKELAKTAEIPSLEAYRLEPNSMQVKFITSLRKIFESGENKALLISATGTGKTYASAFAMRELGFRRVLFLVHRNQIAGQARKSYERVFSGMVSTGMVAGKYMEHDADYIFATVQTMSKDEVLESWDPSSFDAIIIDEAHHSSAGSYRKVMEHFAPQLWLGMTATPDRRDAGTGSDSIYDIFNHQIAYEIRLQHAMEEDLLCPFHYFGITDLEVIADEGRTAEEKIENFRYLTSDERVDNVVKQAEYFGHSGDRVRGLIFCSRNREARELSAKFNERGFRTTALTGENTEAEREEAVQRLAGDECENALDYILSVDIFSEGVDVPEINQVIMLRPTQSPVVFIQQLGRGLRKAEGKEYVVVLDFIGNYNNNFMIPVALSGDRTYNKDTIRRYVMEGGRVIPGCSTIHFDEVSRRKIFESIDRMAPKSTMLREKYFQLKDRLGRIPTVLDFYDHGEIDPMMFIAYSRTYDSFVRKYDKDYNVDFSQEETAMLEFVSSLLVNGKRPHELLMLQMLLEDDAISEETFCERLEKAGMKNRHSDYISAMSILRKDFINTQSEQKKYSHIEFVDCSSMDMQSFSRAAAFYRRLQRKEFIEELQALVSYGLKKYRDKYSEHDEDNLVLYEKYSRKDVCRLLNWERDDSATVYGYRIKYGTCPIFVTYKKKEDIAESTKYEDAFINEQIFSWMTRSRVSEDSTEAQQIINSADNGLRIYLFIKKSDGEGSDFYYMGRIHPVRWEETVIKNDKGQSLPIMNFIMQMEHSVRSDIYEYITG